jgi:hypothetical protein
MVLRVGNYLTTLFITYKRNKKMSYNTKFAADFQRLDANYRQPDAFIRNMAKNSDKFRALILQGPAGVGKTHSVEQALKKHAAGRYELINGMVTNLSLYGSLYRASNNGHILFLDDCDSFLKDATGVNILKAAMDTKPNREIHWESSTHLLKALGIPNKFTFNGSVVLNTNIGYDNKNTKIIARLSALVDRALTICISDSDPDHLFKQVCYMVLVQDMLDSYEFSDTEKNMLLMWIDNNRKFINRISLRTIIKLSSIYSADKNDWQDMAEQGLLVGFNYAE